MSAMTSQITSLAIIYSWAFIQAQIKENKKLRVTGRCEWNSPVTGDFNSDGMDTIPTALLKNT